MAKRVTAFEDSKGGLHKTEKEANLVDSQDALVAKIEEMKNHGDIDRPEDLTKTVLRDIATIGDMAKIVLEQKYNESFTHKK